VKKETKNKNKFVKVYSIKFNIMSTSFIPSYKNMLKHVGFKILMIKNMFFEPHEVTNISMEQIDRY